MSDQAERLLTCPQQASIAGLEARVDNLEERRREDFDAIRQNGKTLSDIKAKLEDGIDTAVDSVKETQEQMWSAIDKLRHVMFTSVFTAGLAIVGWIVVIGIFFLSKGGG